eukprot:5461872-Pleurochrysis_carterae.AAC.1
MAHGAGRARGRVVRGKRWRTAPGGESTVKLGQRKAPSGEIDGERRRRKAPSCERLNGARRRAAREGQRKAPDGVKWRAAPGFERWWDSARRQSVRDGARRRV